MLIGELIRDWRTLNRLGVREAARMIGTSHSTLNRVERGEEVDGDTLVKIFTWAFARQAQKGSK